MKKSITYNRLFAFVNAGAAYVEKHKDAENKLCSAIKSVTKQIKKEELVDNYQERIRDYNLDVCSVDEKTKVILKDPDGSLQFTVEAQKKSNKFVKDISKETVEIHVRISPETNELVSTLTEKEKDAFSGIVINEIIEE